MEEIATTGAIKIFEQGAVVTLLFIYSAVVTWVAIKIWKHAQGVTENSTKDRDEQTKLFNGLKSVIEKQNQAILGMKDELRELRYEIKTLNR